MFIFYFKYDDVVKLNYIKFIHRSFYNKLPFNLQIRLRVCFSSSSYAQRAKSNFTKPYSLHVNLYEISDSVRRKANFADTPFIPIRAVLH